MGRKPSIYTEVRRNNIRTLMLEGKATSYIVAYCNHTYGVTRKTVEKDISKIYVEIGDEFQKTKEIIMELHVSRYERLYEFYMDRGNEEDGLNTHFDPEKAAKMLERKERLLGVLNKQSEVIAAVQVNNFQLPQEIVNMIQGSSIDNLKKSIQYLENE